MKTEIDSTIHSILAAGDYQSDGPVYSLRYFPLTDGRLLTINFTSPKGATIGIVIDKDKKFAVTINDYYYTEAPKGPGGSGLFDDTEQIQDNKLGALVEEALNFFENLFDLEEDARRRARGKRLHEVAMKELLDQI
jgi:hypothetical protein